MKRLPVVLKPLFGVRLLIEHLVVTVKVSARSLERIVFGQQLRRSENIGIRGSRVSLDGVCPVPFPAARPGFDVNGQSSVLAHDVKNLQKENLTMSALPNTFSRYRENTASDHPYSNRKMCASCKEGRPMLGGQQMARPGSARKTWICGSCARRAPQPMEVSA